MKHLSVHVLREPKVRLRDRGSRNPLTTWRCVTASGIMEFSSRFLYGPSDDGYEIIEGFHRFTCAKEVGLETVPCLIRQAATTKPLSCNSRRTRSRRRPSWRNTPSS